MTFLSGDFAFDFLKCIFFNALSKHVKIPLEVSESMFDMFGHQCTWYSHTEQSTVVDNRDEAQDTFGPLQLLRFQAQLLVAGHCHIGPVDHDLGASPRE